MIVNVRYDHQFVSLGLRDECVNTCPGRLGRSDNRTGKHLYGLRLFHRRLVGFRLINAHTGLEVTHVIPTKSIPKTTSGKIQRHLLAHAFIDGEFDAAPAELGALREVQGGTRRVSTSELESRLQSICEAVLPTRRIDIDDNLFEIGASSLKLIEIQESINRDFSALIDLTELFDYPTIGKLARRLQDKLGVIGTVSNGGVASPTAS